MVSLMVLLVTVPAMGKEKSPAAPAPPKTYKMTTPIPASIPIPDQVQTRFGTLNFFDGVPA